MEAKVKFLEEEVAIWKEKAIKNMGRLVEVIYWYEEDIENVMGVDSDEEGEVDDSDDSDASDEECEVDDSDEECEVDDSDEEGEVDDSDEEGEVDDSDEECEVDDSDEECEVDDSDEEGEVVDSDDDSVDYNTWTKKDLQKEIRYRCRQGTKKELVSMLNLLDRRSEQTWKNFWNESSEEWAEWWKTGWEYLDW